ncbi:HEAT repeat domain-containing protein [Streptomyces sp. NPDC052023]|uniref:HEAT repeat domain-containing protein n=1 Tax=Streptomyces sp. NPDC052023 TaxID=3365681 RepID=UPI0037D095EF
MVMTVDQDGQGSGSLERYGRFLARQAAEAGLSARTLAERFEEEARRQEQAAAVGRPPQNPIRDMSCSKSTIDRLLKGRAFPQPPRAFTRQFLTITSKAAGLSQQEFERRWTEACALLEALSHDRVQQRVQPQLVALASGPSADTVARLRLEVDLEHARHTVTQLNYALRDTRVLVTTLWDIIDALRGIIAGHYADQTRLVHGGGTPAHLARIQSETERALGYKRAAQAEADRAASRLRTLEERWERAHAELLRLSVVPDAAQIAASDTASPEAGAPPLPPRELLAQPALDALDDIKAALDKARVVNAQGEEEAGVLQGPLSDSGPYAPDDERLVLLAATRLSGSDGRRTALDSLVTGWPRHPDTRATLLRLAADPDPEVRFAVAHGLAEHWKDDGAAHDTLALLARDTDEFVRGGTAYGMVTAGWRDDWVLGVLVSLARDPKRSVRAAAAEGLAVGWPRSRTARNALLGLLLSVDKDIEVRKQAVEGLLKNWLHTAEARDGLLRLACGGQDPESTIAAQALAGILAHWLHNSRTRAAVLRLDPREYLFNLAQKQAVERWGGLETARDSVIRLSETNDMAVLQALSVEPAIPADGKDAAERAVHFRAHAVDMLQEGWAGDTVARGALLQLARDPSPHVRTKSGAALIFRWSDDDTARRAIDQLAQDPDEDVRMIINVELRWPEQRNAPPAP